MTFADLLINVSWLSILLFFIGVGFIIAEMFNAGFSFFWVIGIICLIGCIFVTAKTAMEGVILTIFFFVLLLILLGIFLVLVSKGKLPRKLVLKDAESLRNGYSGTKDLTEYNGKTGVVTAICRPVGSVDFDGAKVEVVSLGEFIEKGTTVEVIEVEGNRVVVRAVS